MTAIEDQLSRGGRITLSNTKVMIIPPKEILRMVVGDLGKLSGGEPTNRYFRELGFTVGEADDDVATPDVIEDAIDTKLHLESDLEGFLVTDLGQLERNLKLYVRDGVRGQQLDAGVAGASTYSQ